jgi:Spherulation-specific family 4
VVGCVYTSYTARSIGSVEADMNSYNNLYGVQGIFFDEMSNIPGQESYYSSLNAYSKSNGLSFTVGNPGAPVPSSYVGTMDCIITYENVSAPSISSIAQWTQGYPRAG